MTTEQLEERIRGTLRQLSTALVADLACVLERLVAALGPERIHVFGSQARGEATADSDIDLLLVVPKATEPGYRLDQAAYCAAGSHSLRLDILVMPQEEFEWRTRALSSLPATVLREGHLLYAA
ncbi:MAG TPA: nucleotidyltransferase domain-containing protein [Thermomicrobiaceae bacterium]|nr:nucleotidyltransferase domain-containing protein [Thermomicrobiaceae bacterium]